MTDGESLADPMVFTRFYRRNLPSGIAMCRRRSLSEEDAYDLTQAAMVVIFQTVKAGKPIADPDRYFRGTLWRLSSTAITELITGRELVVKLGLQIEDSLPDRNAVAAPGATPHLVYAAKEQRERLWEAVRDLADKYKASLVLENEGFDIEERAAIKGVPKGTERVHSHRARQHAARLIGQRAPDLRPVATVKDIKPGREEGAA